MYFLFWKEAAHCESSCAYEIFDFFFKKRGKGKSEKSVTRDYQESLPDQNPDWKKIIFFNNFFFRLKNFRFFFWRTLICFGSRKITEFLDFRYFGVVDPSRVLRSALYCIHLLYSWVLSIGNVSEQSHISNPKQIMIFQSGRCWVEVWEKLP